MLGASSGLNLRGLFPLSMEEQNCHTFLWSFRDSVNPCLPFVKDILDKRSSKERQFYYCLNIKDLYQKYNPATYSRTIYSTSIYNRTIYSTSIYTRTIYNTATYSRTIYIAQPSTAELCIRAIYSRAIYSSRQQSNYI